MGQWCLSFCHELLTCPQVQAQGASAADCDPACAELDAEIPCPAQYAEAIGCLLDRIDICTAYRCGSRTLTEFPSDTSQLAACEPIYETMAGWPSPTKGVRRFEDLPEAARRYIARLEEVSGVRVALVSTGSERDDTILRPEILPIAELRLPI